MIAWPDDRIIPPPRGPHRRPDVARMLSDFYGDDQTEDAKRAERTRITPAIVAVIEFFLCCRCDPADIAERLQITAFVALQVCGRMAFSPPDANANGQPYTAYEADIARTMTKNKMNARAIANELSRTMQSVAKWRAAERKRVEQAVSNPP